MTEEQQTALHMAALNYRTAATLHAEGAWRALTRVVEEMIAEAKQDEADAQQKWENSGGRDW